MKGQDPGVDMTNVCIFEIGAGLTNRFFQDLQDRVVNYSEKGVGDNEYQLVAVETDQCKFNLLKNQFSFFEDFQDAVEKVGSFEIGIFLAESGGELIPKDI